AALRRGDLDPSTAGAIDLLAEAVLDHDIRSTGALATLAGAPSAVLLTGVTGFLGAFLLHELLQQTQADIYCLVRAADAEHAILRIRRNLETYLLWDARLEERIIPVIGDLSQPRLGLAEPQFQALSRQIDLIYHNGAAVNFIYPYQQLKATNVLGTQE